MQRVKKGFTLIEILLVIAIIAILAGIVILAINPLKQLGDSHNAQRRSDVTTILNAVYQYTIDNNALPTGISTSTQLTVCRTGIATCLPTTSYVDLSVLTTSSTYLVSVPLDPSNTDTTGTGYRIIKTVNNRVTVDAPLAEQGATISVTR